MRWFHLEAVVEDSKRSAQGWQEFLRVDAMSMGVYRLRRGQTDGQVPHTEDEVYYVVSGRGKFRAGAEERSATPGAIFYVERLEDHRFLNIEEDLTVLVFFAPEAALATL
jgi:mannose-6-phosphate isomerase-like protein (cupin superfamily)